MKLLSKLKHFHWRICIWKCRLPKWRPSCLCLNVLTELCCVLNKLSKIKDQSHAYTCFFCHIIVYFYHMHPLWFKWFINPHPLALLSHTWNNHEYISKIGPYQPSTKYNIAWAMDLLSAMYFKWRHIHTSCICMNIYICIYNIFKPWKGHTQVCRLMPSFYR